MRVTVRVPATSANLGPGFDSFGLALDLCNEVALDTDDVGVRWQGEGADELPVDGSDLVSRTIAAVAADMAEAPPPFALEGRNAIPLERGLGSSSAAAVAGVVLASRLLGLGIDADPYSVWSLAARIEGHPDNAAPAVYGGFTIVADRTVRRLDPDPRLRPVVLVPRDARLPTAEARDALDAAVDHADATFNAAHAALAVVALTSDPSLLRAALRDRLHQARRLALVPEVEEVFDGLVARHVPVCVSGAGPSLLAFETDDGDAVDAVVASAQGRWGVLRPGLRARGFEVLEG